jgi:CubicO group peptidase (beta-lactamase class C family)
MRLSSITLLAFPIFYQTVTSSEAQIPLKSRNKFNESHFITTITSFMEERSIPGLSVAVTYDDRLVYDSGFGYADIENQRLVSTRDRFRLASVSKSITAIAIMHLEELGALTISQRVFGPDGILGHTYGREPYSAAVLNITVQHLLDHTSGFVDDDMCGKGCDPTYLPQFLNLDQWELIGALLDEYDPSHEPGTFASYSNFGYFIAGRVVEASSGIYPYEKHVREEVLAKMGVTEMRIARNDSRKHEVEYYDPKDPTGPYHLHVERRDSVGAWIATPIDLVKIATRIDGLRGQKDFLNKTTKALMYEPTPVEGSDYAKGWRVKVNDGQPVEAVKDGGYSGTNSILEINFVNKTSFAIVINRAIPNDDKFHGADDLKTLMDGLIGEVEEWPEWDLFG